MSIHRRVIATGIAAAVMLGAAACPLPSQPPDEGDAEASFFYVDGKEHPITVARDRLGVALVEGVGPERLDPVLHGLGMRRVPTDDPVAAQGQGGRSPSEAIVVVSVDAPQDALELAKRARVLKDAARDVAAQTGLLVFPRGSKTPMIATDEIIVHFSKGTGRADIERFAAADGLEFVAANPVLPEQALLRITERTGRTSIDASNAYEKREGVEYAHPNFVQLVELRATIPNDTLFANQWHHQNTGQSMGTPDADVDTPDAWDFTMGEADVLIAVIDSGFDVTHPDLVPNLWENPSEVPGNTVDEDGNGYLNDVHGWNFEPCTSSSAAGCGNATLGTTTLFGTAHGTAAAGSAAARGNNMLGTTGTCPSCQFLPIRNGSTNWGHALAFAYAQQAGAAIISNSWGYVIGAPIPTAVSTAIDAAATAGRGGLGSVVLFAMNNPNVNDCGASPDISSLPSVIAVSRSTNRDRFDLSGYGNCMDLLAPSAEFTTVSSGRGTLWATTTDVTGTAGINNTFTYSGGGGGDACPSHPESASRDYTACFGGTSFACPETAGIAGLVLSVNPSLTRLQVQRLLQDTADKIEDSAGSYAASNGFSTPSSGNATHGYGRVNAFEAVRIAASTAVGGRGGADLFFRDNRLDWGNTEQPSNTLFEATRGFVPHWVSEDIKVDAPPFDTPPTATTWDAFADQTPSAVPGEVNRVYVRVHNRGQASVTGATVKLYWTQFGTALPALPPDFWSRFPANSMDLSNRWNPLTCQSGSPACTTGNVGYSGASVAATSTDEGQIVAFDFPAPPVDSGLANHFCLLAMVDAPADPISTASRSNVVVDAITPTDNNVTHRNYLNLPTTRTERSTFMFVVRNPDPKRVARVLLEAKVPKGWELSLHGVDVGQHFELPPNHELEVKAEVLAPKEIHGELHIVQTSTFAEGEQVIGGLVMGAPEPQRKRAPKREQADEQRP